jgi:hypothetical protein
MARGSIMDSLWWRAPRYCVIPSRLRLFGDEMQVAGVRNQVLSFSRRSMSCFA